MGEEGSIGGRDTVDGRDVNGDFLVFALNVCEWRWDDDKMIG